MKFRQIFKRTAVILLTLLIAVSVMPVFFMQAYAQGSVHTVKAGFFRYPGYHELENGVRSGYGYDFLALLQRYTDFKYEYVGYENSWEEMQQMLLDGEIDFVTSARKTQEREKLFDFSEPIGTNKAQLNVRLDDERFIPGDYSALNGIVIGELSGNSRNADTEKFASEKGFTYTVKEYQTAEELQKALQNGEVDAIATSSLRKSSNEKTIAEFAPEDFFVIVKKGNKDLLNEINYGISQMDINEGNWRDDLYYKNYVSKNISVLSFTQKELAYIKAVQNGEKTITVTAQPDRNPYSYVENGKLSGIIPDYFAHLMETAGLPYTTLIAKDRDEFQTWTMTNHTDVIMDYRYGISPSSGLDFGVLTDSYMTLTMSRLTRKDFSGKIHTIAIIESQDPDYIEEDIAEDVEYIFVKTREETMQYVRDGKADACYVFTYMAEKFINQDSSNVLTSVILKNPVYSIYIYINPDTDHELCSILNKCIKSDAEGTLDFIISKYTNFGANIGLIQYLTLHPVYIIVSAAVLLVILAFIVFVIIRANIARVRNAQLEHEVEQKKKLEESNRIIGTLSKDFGCVNYVVLTGNKAEDIGVDFRTSELLKRVIPGWENVKSFAKKLELLTEYAVYEPDKEQFYAGTRREHIVNELKDKDTHFVNVRLVIDGEIRYYQFKFTAVRENGELIAVVAGLHSVDEQTRNEIEAQDRLEKALSESREAYTRIAQQNAFNRYFLEPYMSAYYIGFDDLSCLVFKRTEQLEDDYPIITNYIDSLSDYIEKEVVPEDREEFKKLIQPEKMKELLSQQPEFSYVFKTGYSGVYSTIRFQVIRGADENHAAFGFKDITEEVTEQQKQQRQLEDALSMAESANRAKTTFLNNMSHDIRTPMNAIIGFTGLAASHIDNKAQVQDFLNKIGQSSDHLLSLINDVLDMSRIESGKMNLDEKPENLPNIIHTLRDIVQADIHSKQHDFFIDTVNVNDEDIMCDKLRLNQVLLNVLSNSIKYTAAGGTIAMRITEITVKQSGYATYEFRIKDNGMGMDKEFLKTIFDPFSRMRSSTVSGIQGTGLGMAITKNIIDMMGGKIDIQSEPGKGTETIITLDFKLVEEHKESVVIPELKGLRGLVADDDSNTAFSIQSMLKEVGMRAEWCTSGKEAVFRAEGSYREGDAFKVYIIDWLMPDMNGIETTRRIRKVIGNDTPIIILTAYDWTDIEDEAREAGVTAFVSKPLFPSDLQRVLSSCFGMEEEKAEQTDAGFSFDGKKILLVEDNELNREIAVDILEENGFVVDTATDGNFAVDIIRNANPGDYDIVLMDIQMPTMDGYEATREIRALGTEISKIPIIAMTANAFEEDRKAALEAGMNEHIAKPIDIDILKKTLAKFI